MRKVIWVDDLVTLNNNVTYKIKSIVGNVITLVNDLETIELTDLKLIDWINIEKVDKDDEVSIPDLEEMALKISESIINIMDSYGLQGGVFLIDKLTDAGLIFGNLTKDRSDKLAESLANMKVSKLNEELTGDLLNTFDTFELGSLIYQGLISRWYTSLGQYILYKKGKLDLVTEQNKRRFQEGKLPGRFEITNS